MSDIINLHQQLMTHTTLTLGEHMRGQDVIRHVPILLRKLKYLCRKCAGKHMK